MSEEQEKQERKKAKEGLLAYLERWWGELPIWVKLCLFIGTFVALIITWFFCPELAKFIGYMIGGGLLTLQILASNRRATAAEKTAKLTERGNIAERFKNAIEHLGNKSVSIRLGGIYALHHIAQEVKGYRERVFEILCAHIRETTAQKAYKPRIVVLGWKEPTIEIQSILNLLFVKTPGREIYKKFRANLEKANLAGARLREANLLVANLLVADLQEAYLQGAYLQGAYLQGADLQKADLQEADLQGAYLQGADLQKADLIEAKNLEVKQLLEAKTLYKAKLPEGMEEIIRQQNLKLFEKPSDEEDA